ncbi:Virulence-associated E [Sphingomonadaceae bacterium]
MASIAPLQTPISPLAELQRAYCLFKLGGEVWIGDLDALKNWKSGVSSELALIYRRQAGRVLMERHLEKLPVSADPTKVLRQFLNSPITHVFDALAFSPEPTPPTICNLWVGPQVQPAAGDWGRIQSFLLEVICDGDIALYRYLVLFLAHMLQRPEEKPGIMIALLGGQGTGKGTLFKILKALWSRTTLLVSDVDNVIGRFNASIERTYVVCMDEALFAGDRKAMDRLKSLVTEPTVTIEEKHQPRRSIESFHRFFAASNHRHFAQVDADDRRFIFFRVSEGRKGDHAYWTRLHRALADVAVIAAMVHDLSSYDLTNFNARQRPCSAAHIDQKVQSLSGFARYWFEVLQVGDFDPGGDWIGSAPWLSPTSGPTFVSTEGLMRGWKVYEGSARQFSPKQEREIHHQLSRLCPSVVSKRRQINGRQQRGHDLPDLSVARAEFAKFLGGAVAWCG